MKTIFKRESKFYNPLFVNGREVYRFYIFSTATEESKNIIGSFRWLTSGCIGSSNSLNSFTINEEIKTKRKFDGTGKTKLFITKEINHNESVNVVYIHSSLVTLHEEAYTSLNYDTYTQERYKIFIKDLEYTSSNLQQVNKLGVGFSMDGKRTQTEKQKSHEKIIQLFSDKFGNKVPSYYLSDLAKFFKQNSRIANKAGITNSSNVSLV